MAWLSADRLTTALTEIVDRFGHDAHIDLRANAYGHGARDIESRARAHGIRHFTRDGQPAPSGAGHDLGLLAYGFAAHQEPVLRLYGEVVAVKSVAAGTAVSYGYQYRTPQAATLALVALGYADGLPRLASSRGIVAVGQARGVVAGRIAMDQLVVDLGGANAAIGDDAVMWHDTDTLAQWCVATERSAATLTARLGKRIVRRWDDA